jgi:hypothetical protein
MAFGSRHIFIFCVPHMLLAKMAATVIAPCCVTFRRMRLEVVMYSESVITPLYCSTSLVKMH